ncbi:zinc finger BED domain-containing protein RICESLEEPER 2-like [Primulina tabacum]|uniref:zinc finger BED domain-containing protein RICESLEEPER 2-like n=1 Tax=Primulina tabacum TaxID=48773 RepID=UPI003F5A8E6E
MKARVQMITPNSSSVDSVDVGKKRKSVRPRSLIWEHFEKYEDSNGTRRAKCNYCGSSYAADSSLNGTSSLGAHLKKCKKYPCNVETKQAKIAFQNISKDHIIINAWRFDQEGCRKALAKMILVDELPFSFVEMEGFRHFINVIQPSFRIPSRRTITRDCFELFLEEKKNLKLFFKETRLRVCLTTDTWTSIQRINYMCLTAHFIDKNWNLQKRILNFSPISSHKGDDMAIVITKCLLDWGLDKVFTITVDNASSNDTTVKEMSNQLSKWGSNLMDGKHLHVRCVAHIINLIVQDGLKEVGDSVRRVRQAIRYIRQSPARIKKFKDCCELEKITSKKSLCLDVVTRWNSTYLMLKVALEFENAFVSYGIHDPGLLDHLLTHVCEDGKDVGALTSVDWENVRKMEKFLEAFYNLTLRVSGSSYVTSNIHFHEIGELSCVLKLLAENDDSVLATMAKRMKFKFDKYRGAPGKMNKMIFIACVLDPRFKFDYVAFVLSKMYGQEKGEQLRVEIKLYMTSLFEGYKKVTSKMSQGSSTSKVEPSGINIGNIHKRTLIQQEYLRHKAESGNMDAKIELDRYLDEDVDVANEHFDILLWWKINSSKFPTLAEMARDVLAIPISTVASENAFSTGGRVLDSFRSSLTPRLVQALICLQDWFRKESSPIKVEEDLDHLEEIESDLINIRRDSCIGRDSCITNI